ncbi:OsmC family protein [Streptomyces fagopyri]|uniref:OsmC family protein n=1 Tax=Streptomyces fagopyri TaxID=2662397 RepID=UPI0037202BF5
MNARDVTVGEGEHLARSIAAGPHTMTADELQPIGSDTGPTPVEFLLAALGSCTSMALRTYADRHSWPLDRIEVTVRFDSQHQIIKDVRLSGDLEPAQIERLLTVAGRCPVQRLLTRQASIITVPTVLGMTHKGRVRSGRDTHLVAQSSDWNEDV